VVHLTKQEIMSETQLFSRYIAYPRVIQTDSVVHSVSYQIGTRDIFLAGKADGA
jgi:hypothetical protein